MTYRADKNRISMVLFCGGPSMERGISLNSARSVADHLQKSSINLIPIYFDLHKKPYLITRAMLYSNTPSDFDFKLAHTASALSKKSLLRILKSVDLCFSVIHGAMGEDGEIQSFLEKNNIPSVGSESKSCKLAFHKHRANEFIRKAGFYAVPSDIFKINESYSVRLSKARVFFRNNRLKRAIVKPARSGSSIGVHLVTSPKEAMEALQQIFSRRLDTQAVIEPFMEGKEFTVIILQNRFNQPVAVLPTEIEIDYSKDQIFSYRRKYLPTRQVAYHCPPRFSKEVIERIQTQAEQLFTLFGMRDFARFDGWLLENGKIWFSDFNLVSGMEQNSFLFQQASQIGMSHEDILLFIIRRALARLGKVLPIVSKRSKSIKKKFISVLFGGGNTERQVSLMSGTNVWLKLRQSDKYSPKPYLLDKKGFVWRLPYAYTLHHTVEEIADACVRAKIAEPFLKTMRNSVIQKLALHASDTSENFLLPKRMTLKTFIRNSSRVFIALHGGVGENGTLQRILQKARIPFNGSKEKASRLCMDKFETGEFIRKLAHKGIGSPEKKMFETKLLFKYSKLDLSRLWTSLQRELLAETIIVKPTDDGCSAGVVRLFSPRDLENYLTFLKEETHQILPGTFTGQHDIIEMPGACPKLLLFEAYVITDFVRIAGHKLQWVKRSGLIEITCGLVGKKGKMKALNPSLTIATGNVLSIEEKFQGGTGVNITPPPKPFVSKKAVIHAKKRMEIIAKSFGLEGYARVDAFMNVKTGEILVIEVNTLPALTPSTVLFHQALAEHPPLSPLQFLEQVVELSLP